MKVSLTDEDIVNRLFERNDCAARYFEAIHTAQGLSFLSDAVATQIAASEGPEAVGAKRSRSTFESPRSLGQLFGAIRVNPNSERRTRLIGDSFVYGEGPLPRAYDQAAPINGSPAELRHFIDVIVNRSAEMASANHSSIPKWRRVDLVLGERGVGKTFFQNYVLSKFSKEFDANKTLWIRVNLIKEFGQPKDIDIDHWVKTQITKVLCRYYDPNSQARRDSKTDELTIDFFKEIPQRIRKHKLYDPVDLTKSLRYMLSNFYLNNPDAERETNDRSVDPLIADYVFQTARDKGFRFVIVFDGLDQLGFTDVYQQRYEHLIHALKQYFTTDTASYRYHLLFIRPESLADISEHILQCFSDSPYLDGNHGATFGLRPVNLRALFKNRITALANEATAKAYKIDILELAAFGEFINTHTSELADKRGQLLKYVDALDQINGCNARSSVQTIQVAYHAFASGEVAGFDAARRSYLLTEHVMRAGMEYPPCTSRYQRIPGTPSRLRRIYVPRLYDTNFLPNIFRYPFDPNKNANEILGGNDGSLLLIGLRLLQCVTAFRQEERSSASGVAATRHQVFAFLETVFDYPEDLCHLMLQEFVEEELLLPVHRGDIRLLSSEDRLFEISPKGLSILDYFCFDVTYLSLASYNVPLPTSVLLTEHVPRYFSAAKSGANLEWILAKLENSISLYKIIEETNRRQEQGVMSKKKKRDQHALWVRFGNAAEQVSPQHGGIFSFTTKMRKNIEKVSSAILGRLRENRDLYDAVIVGLRI